MRTYDLWHRLPPVAWWLLAAVVVLGAPLAMATGELFQLSLIYLYGAAAIGLNLAVGFAGQLFLGQVAVMGVAAYAAGLLNVKAGWSPWATLVPALVAGMVLGLLTGLVGLRLGRLYLGMVSFFLVVVLPDVVNSFPSVTGGDNGLIGMTQLFPLTGSVGTTDFYLLAAVILVASFLAVRAILKSGWGVRLRALRDAPEALASCGVDPTETRLVIYCLTSLFGALAGWGLAYLNGFVASGLFDVNLMLLLLAAVALGGQGTLVGPLVGMAIVGGYNNLVGAFSIYNSLGLGIVLMAVVLIFPGGLAEVGVKLSSAFLARTAGQRDRAAAARPASPVRTDSGPIPQWLASAGPPGKALEVVAVTKSFQGIHAVAGVDLDIAFGEALGLVGANGSGKTTLVNLVTGIYRPNGGQVSIASQRSAKRRPHQVARLGVCRTFQVPQLLREATVRENVELGLVRRYRQPVWLPLLRPLKSLRIDRSRRADADQILGWLGLPERLWGTDADSLPLGTQRRLEVGRAVATGARILCLDEPAAGLSQDELDLLGKLIIDLKEEGRAVLLIEHNRRFVAGVADAAVLMRHGQIVDRASLAGASGLPEFLQAIRRGASTRPAEPEALA
jgi:ABC-type branched-subunit amino acid transport system ATPase component/ABC-type branched-subunit amino acid transport system permease subunit